LRWEEHFDQLVDLEPGERARRLSALERADPELASLLERMLAADDGDTELLAGPLADRSPSLLSAALSVRSAPAGGDRTGEEVGRYRLLSLLGRGGMAEVWLAERADGEFEQRVAIKLVRPEVGSEAVLARFLRERRILARLEHPGIAHLLDGGRTESGEPYFVLEHVDGTPVTEWCTARSSPLEERLRLMIEVCEAVDHAHRSLVVHRDLKPSNVLVDRAGRPKLLDFGIAKLLARMPGDLAASGETRLGAVAFTPAYAAPEQILGEPVTTATDVYALGVLLYELTTGEKPNQRSTRLPLPVLAREVEAETVERPSERLRRAIAAGTARPEARRLAAGLEGDLDTIILKALHRHPGRRYPSAAALGEDLRRLLAGHPVAARPDNLTYRASRFIGRHRWAVVAALLVAVSVLGGLAVSLWQARIARAEARRADRVKGFLVDLFREADPSHTQGATITAREILATGASRVGRELRSEPEVQAELLDVIAQVESSLGLYKAAEQRARTVIALRSRLYGPSALETAASRTTLAEALYELGQSAAARRELAAAGAAIAALDKESSDTANRFASVRVSILWENGETEEALAEARRRLALAQAQDGPESLPAARWQIALVGLLADSWQAAEAHALALPALAALQRAPEASPVEIAAARVLVGETLAFAGEKKQGADLQLSGVQLARQTLGPRHPTVAFDELKYGFALLELHRAAEAEPVLRDAYSILMPLQHFEAGTALRNLGFAAMKRHHFAEAERRFSEAEKVFRARLPSDHIYIRAARLSRTSALVSLGRLAEAETGLRVLARDFERIQGPQGNSVRTALAILGEVRRRRGDVAEALALHHRERDIALAIFGTTEHSAVATADLGIALDHLARPTPEGLAEARARTDEGIAVLRKIDPENPRLDELLVASGRLALHSGDRARAVADLAEAEPRLAARWGEADAEVREARALLATARRGAV